MPGRTDGRIICQSSHRDVNVLPVAHEGVKQRAACLAPPVVGNIVADKLKIGRPLAYSELAARDAREWFERRSRRPAAIEALAIGGILKFVGHVVAH